MKRKPAVAPPSRSNSSPDPSLHRSSAVAHMLNMPVATLRNWERRYGVTQPTLSPGGQRLYSAEDVRRLVLIRRLTELGHAIGSLAALDMQALQGVAATHANALASRHEAEPLKAAPAAPHRAWRLAVIGTGLAARLQRPALLRRLGLPLQLLGPFDDAAQAAAALRDAEPDAVLIHLPHLNEDCLTAIDVLAPSLAAAPKALLFSFAADAVCEDLASAGVALLREPQPDAVLAQWLRNLAGAAAAPPPPGANPIARATEAISPRRWTEEALREFAGRPLTMGCECPRHVAELLMQLAHFEAYSAECEQRNAADADLHAYLGRVAAASRARFEVALEHLAVHEGLLLPPPALSSQA